MQQQYELNLDVETKGETFTITHESLEEVLCLIAKITPIEYVFDEDNTVRITRK